MGSRDQIALAAPAAAWRCELDRGRRSGRGAAVTPPPVLPGYGGACIASLVPALLDPPGDRPSWLPTAAADATQVVLLVLDGLGWQQLRARAGAAPRLATMSGGPITSVAPSTTATALTSLTTGVPPGVHGIVGYRIHVGGGTVLNVLRWRTSDGSQEVAPRQLQPHPPFGGRSVPVVSRGEFAGSGFSAAHLDGARLHSYWAPSSLAVEVRRLVAAGEPFVYAYYDGIDKIAHAHGFGEHFDAELAAADRMVGDLLDVLPRDATLVVTSDHGQVDVGDACVPLDAAALDDVEVVSGEARFRWLHTRPGTARRVAARIEAAHGELAWVRSRDEVLSEGWLGSTVTADAAARLGDVVVAASAPVAFFDPREASEVRLRCRHGSLTPDEMLVPVVAANGSGGEG